MNCIPDFCSLCLVSNPKLINIILQDNDGIVIEEKLKVFLQELVVFKPYIVKYVCERCLETTNFIYKFKKKCVENMTTLSEYLQKFEAQTSSCNVNLEINQHEGSENKNKRKENLIEDEPGKNKTYDNLIIKPAEAFVKTEIDINMETTEDTDKHTDDEIISDSDNDNDVKNTQQSEIINNAALSSNTSSKKANPETYKKCSLCLKPFKYRHQCEKLSNLDSYDCSVCLKTFKRRHHLMRHTLTHTGERPYACEVCDKAFSQISHLIRHRTTHTGDKPYACDVCDKRFNRSDQLNTHKRTHTGVKPFKCDMCDKKYNRTDLLLNHKRKHTAEERRNCV